MTVPQRPSFPRQTPRTRGSGGSILAVGRRVLVSCPDGGAGRATLTDVKGSTALATLPHGAEVEILGWQPRHAGGTRYWIRSSERSVEGWVAGESLSAPAPKTPPALPVVAAASAPQRAPVPAKLPPNGVRTPAKATRGAKPATAR